MSLFFQACFYNTKIKTLFYQLFQENYYFQNQGTYDINDPLFIIKRIKMPLKRINYFLAFIMIEKKNENKFSFQDEMGGF